VTSRYHASLNPNAHKRELITLEDHQRSTMVASPLRLLDVSLISDGAGAFVVTTKDRAKDLPNAGVGVRGWGMATTHHIVSQAPDVDELGAKPAAQLALSRAGMRADEADVVYIHDACTISTILGVEALGLCREGEGGAYAAEGRLRLGQPHPVNVHGGMLSHGHAGGVFHLIDAVCQLRGEAGERQVSGARRAIVSGNGGVLSTFSTMVLERL
jgi:acetyl-CoA acetyltransferase